MVGISEDFKSLVNSLQKVRKSRSVININLMYVIFIYSEVPNKGVYKQQGEWEHFEHPTNWDAKIVLKGP